MRLGGPGPSINEVVALGEASQFPRVWETQKSQSLLDGGSGGSGILNGFNTSSSMYCTNSSCWASYLEDHPIYPLVN